MGWALSFAIHSPILNSRSMSNSEFFSTVKSPGFVRFHDALISMLSILFTVRLIVGSINEFLSMKSVPSDSIEMEYDPSINVGVHSANIFVGVLRIVAYLHTPSSLVMTINSMSYISLLS